MTKKLSTLTLFIFAISIPLFPFGTSAQTRDLGLIKGHVADAQGKAVPGADVKLEDKSTKFERDTKTSSDGEYSFGGLPLGGHYVLTITAANFAPATQTDIELRADIAATLDFTMNVAGTSAQITVYGTTTALNVDSNEVSDRLDLTKIENTPILFNKLSYLVLLDSSVKPSFTTGDLFQDELLFVVNGEGRRQTTFSIDNTTADDSWGRQDAFTALPFAAVQEFTVITNAASAEYGRTAGAALNIVTKSGTDKYHGDFNFMGRPDGSQATIKQAPPTPQRAVNSEEQESGAFGGPLFSTKTQFFVAGEYSHQNRDAVITSPLDNAIFPGNYKQGLFFGRIDHQLTSKNHVTIRANFDRFSDTNPQDVVSGISLPTTDRVFTKDTYATAATDTHTFSSNLINEARFQWQVATPITQFVPQFPGPQLSQSGIFTNGDSRFAFLINHQYEEADTLTWVHGHHVIRAGADLVEASSGGFGQEFGSGFLDGQFTVNPALCIQLTTTSSLPNDTQCNTAGNTPIAIPNITVADVTKYTQTFGNQQYNIKEVIWGFFAQDSWNVRPGLTLNLGARYEGQTFTNDNNNIAPRVGFAWQVPHLRGTVLRAGYGIYYSEIRTDEGAGYLEGGPTGLFTFSAAPGQCGFPTSITPFASIAALLASPSCTSAGVTMVPERTITINEGSSASLAPFLNTSLLRFYPNSLLNPYTQQWTLGLEHEIAKGWIFSLDYLGSHTVKLDRNVDLNSPTSCTYTSNPLNVTQAGGNCVLIAPTTTTAGGIRSTAVANATRPVQPTAPCTTTSPTFIAAIANCFNNYAAIDAIVNDGSATYNGVQAKLSKRFSHHYSMLLTYTYSHAIDNVEPDAANQSADDFNQLGQQEKASSLLDQRNRAALSGWYDFPKGFRFGATATLASGFPYNVLTGVDNNGDGVTADRPFLNGVLTPRNSGQGSPLYDVDSSLQKAFNIGEKLHINLRAEAFNLFNHGNFYTRSATFGNTATPVAAFGTLTGISGISQVGPSRMMQFSARVLF
jgi:Carboxypeptidase regulatory-like domain/TonB dependent receptor